MSDNPFEGLLDVRSAAQFVHMAYTQFIYEYRKRPGLNIMRFYGREFFRDDDPVLIQWRDERLNQRAA